MQGTLFPESATIRTGRGCAQVLRRLRAEWELDTSQFHLEHAGERIDRLDHSSRSVFALPDQPFVVKLDYGQHPVQSWHEWAFWHDRVKGHKLEHLFAPTRAIHISAYDHSTRDYLSSKIVTTKFICVMTVQDYVDSDDYGVDPDDCVDGAADVIKSIRVAGFPLADIGTHQCVWHAGRGHWVLVDYGLDAGWSGGTQRRVRERDAIFEEVRTTENPWSRPI